MHRGIDNIPSHQWSSDELRKAVREAAQQLRGYEREFFERVWTTDLDVYRTRLKAIGFEGLTDILDAGCGNGQWTLCLAELNDHICAIDLAESRLHASEHILNALGVTNCDFGLQSIESCGYPDCAFDAVFCYSVLYFSDHRRSLREFFRVLRPGGVLYVCTNGPGWYVYNLLTPHNPSASFDIREMAIKAIANTFEFFSEGHRSPDAQLAVSSQTLRREATAAGFRDVRVGGEGTLASRCEFVPKPFFEPHYLGLEGVYEMLATKPLR